MEVLDSDGASQASSIVEISAQPDPVEVLDSDEESQASSVIEIQAAMTVNEQMEPESGHAVLQVRSLEDLTAARPGGLPRSVADNAYDNAPTHAPPSVDNAIDHLTAELAMLCLDQLKKSLASGNALDEAGDGNDIWEELRVRFER